jgi:peptidoglycan hydrolase-like protein with peptidoglycan-binding domain
MESIKMGDQKVPYKPEIPGLSFVHLPGIGDYAPIANVVTAFLRNKHNAIAWIALIFGAALILTGCASGTINRTATSTMDPPPTRTTVTTATPSPTPQPASATPTEIPSTLTPSPAPTQSSTPAPTLTFTTEPTATPTAIPIPELERVLHLATPEMLGDDVLLMQEWLQALGYTQIGTPDGVFGAKTDDSVRQFQEDFGLDVDGYVGESTWTTLFMLSEAKQIGKRLQNLGYEICDPNRRYSDQTKTALGHFQAINGLEPDGIINTKTWEVLFSGEAAPAPLGSSLAVTDLGEVGIGGRLTFDGESLWLIGSEERLQIDPDSGEVTNTYAFPNLGEVKDSFGGVYPKIFSTDEAFFFNNIVWISGEVLSYPNLSASAVLAFNLSGELVGGPVYLSPNQDAIRWVPALFSNNGRVWAFLDAYPNLTIFEINHLNFQIGRQVVLSNFEGVYDAASDGETIWITMVIDRDRTLRSLNLVNGRTGPPLAACGYELAYDGKWLWVEKVSILKAVDPKSGEIMAHARVNGSAHSMATDGEGRLWILVSKSNSWYLQFITTQ